MADAADAAPPQQQADQPPEPVPQPPPLSALESMPEPAHVVLAACLADGDKKENRLRLGRVSKALQVLHGGTLTKLTVRWRPAHRIQALAGLIQRQHHLASVRVGHPQAFPALTVLLAQGCLTGIRELDIQQDYDYSFNEDVQAVLPAYKTLTHFQGLLGAMEAPGAVQGLEVWRLDATNWSHGIVPMLADVVARDVEAFPALRTLDIGRGPFEDDDLESLALMLQLRASRAPRLPTPGDALELQGIHPKAPAAPLSLVIACSRGRHHVVVVLLPAQKTKGWGAGNAARRTQGWEVVVVVAFRRWANQQRDIHDHHNHRNPHHHHHPPRQVLVVCRLL